MRTPYLAVAIVSGSILSACENTAPTHSPALESLLENSPVTFGETGTTEEVLSRVSDAIILSGNVLVIADRAPPHLRFIDFEGQLIATAGETGDGPEELRSIYSLMPLGDSAVVVFDRNGQTVFSEDGDHLFSRRGYPPDFLLFSGIRSCGEDWLVYGALRESGIPTEGTVGIFSMTPNGGAPEAVHASPTISRRWAFGKLYLISRTEDRSLVFDEYASPPRILSIACEEDSVRVEEFPAEHGPPLSSLERTGEGAAVARITFPDTLPVGLLPAGNSFYWAERIRLESGSRRTEFGLVDDDRPAVMVTGQYVVEDGPIGGRILLSTNQPIPHVIIADEESFLRNLFEGRAH